MLAAALFTPTPTDYGICIQCHKDIYIQCLCSNRCSVCMNLFCVSIAHAKQEEGAFEDRPEDDIDACDEALD